MAAMTLFLITFLSVTSQNPGDFRSTQSGNWDNASSWETYNGASWVNAGAAPSSTFAGAVHIRTGHEILFSIENQDTQFLPNGAVFIEGGEFKIFITSNGNQQYNLSVNHFTLNSGFFIMESGNNPQLILRVISSFNINGGYLDYQGGGPNSSLYIDVEGDVSVTAGLLLISPNLNRSGLYLVGNNTQNITITHNISPVAAQRFFIAEGSTHTINEIYNGNDATPQVTVFGSIPGYETDVREGFIGLHERTTNNNLFINNSGAGVNLSTDRTIGGTLHLQDGTLFRDGNNFTMASGATINRSGGIVNEAPTFAGTINLEYSQHTLQIPTALEMPDADIIQNVTISTDNGVKATKDFKINNVLNLTATNPHPDYGSLELVNDYGNYAQLTYGTTGYNNSTLSHNNFDSHVLMMAPNATTTGIGDVTGTIRREGLLPNTSYDFGNHHTRLTFKPVNGSPIPPAVNVLVSRGLYGEHADNTEGIDINGTTADRAAVKRLYQVRYEGVALTESQFTLRMAYQADEIGGNDTESIISWDHHLPYAAKTPHEHGRTNFDSNVHWVELSNHKVSYLAREGSTTFTKYWMISEKEYTDDYVWLGAADSDWNNVSNWSSGKVPNETADVLIPSAIRYDFPPIIDVTSGYSDELNNTAVGFEEVRMRTLEIAATAVLTVEDGKRIKMYGGPNQNSGGSNINFTTWFDNGTFLPGTGTVQFITAGETTTSTVGGSTRFYDLIVGDNYSDPAYEYSILQLQDGSRVEVENEISFHSVDDEIDTRSFPNTIAYVGNNQEVITTNGDYIGYHSLELSGTGTTLLPAEIDIYGNLIVNQETGLNITNTPINFYGLPTTDQFILSDVLTTLTLNEVEVDNKNVTSELEELTIHDLDLINGTFRAGDNANVILTNLLTRTNGYLGGTGTITFEGPSNLTGYFEDNLATPSIHLNKNAAFIFPEALGISGNLILEQGTVDLNTQTLSLGGNVVRTAGYTGYVDATEATILFTGDNPQTIDNDAFLDNTVENITNNGTGGPSLSSELQLTGILKLNNGDFQSNGHLVFISTETKTALMDRVIVGATISGEVTIERFFKARRAFRLFSSPVNTATTIRANWQEGVNNTTNNPAQNQNPTPGYGIHITGSVNGANGFDATPSGNPSLFSYDNPTQSWSSAANTNATTIQAGTPYRFLVRGDRSINVTSNSTEPTNTRLRTKGVPVTGTQINNAMGLAAGDSNFIGNPYQAPVDMSLVVGASVNINPNFYMIWDPTVGGQNPVPGTPGGRGAFVTIDLEDNTNTVDGEGNSEANQFLQPGQAAFVFTVADGHPQTSVIFEETYKNVEQPLTATFSLISDIKLLLYSAENFAGGHSATDGLRIKFKADGNNEVDTFDAPKFSNLDESLAANNNEALLSIESRALPQDEEVIQLYLNTFRATNYVFEARLNLLQGVTAYLRDHYTGTVTALSNNNNTLIDFSVDPAEPESVATNRFDIIFEEIVLSNPDAHTANEWLLYPNPATGDEVYVSTAAHTSGTLKLAFYTMQGQLVHTTHETIQSNGTVHTDISSLSSGIYVVKITDEQNHHKALKLIVQ
ncbi:hypothetical protein GCM10011312_26670 [Planktosalinus lacus]|uniref:Secretion system C-terminal sorting domain-containing protein n=2 Tax=Planktosalinus lacus TaxID=1526573 RepID=A0A8J2VES6_9FLAO|nr:hypothetical protein GCM10011312_26670 [Planktosalinus lacus]